MWLLTSADDPNVDWEYTDRWRKEERERIEKIFAEVYNRAFNTSLKEGVP